MAWDISHQKSGVKFSTYTAIFVCIIPMIVCRKRAADIADKRWKQKKSRFSIEKSRLFQTTLHILPQFLVRRSDHRLTAEQALIFGVFSTGFDGGGHIADVAGQQHDTFSTHTARNTQI